MQKKKTEIITARMTPADKKAICQRAKAAGMTVTDYLTICALGKEIVRMDGLDGLLSELKAQGRHHTGQHGAAHRFARQRFDR